MPEGFSLPSFAKINWTLRILGRREDGYHELFTIFQTVSLHDTLTFAPSDRLALTCSNALIPTDGSNLIIKAAKALEALTGNKITGDIHLTKNIPSPGGLGGGSSNAAAALVGLVKLCDLDQISSEDMRELAAGLGADVPFFLFGGTASGTGKGDDIAADVPKVAADNMLIVTPPIGLSTADAFSGLAVSALTSEERESSLTVCRNEARSFDPLRSVLVNDFEPTVFAAHLEIKKVRDTLLELGASNAALSGSGASLYAVFDKKETRQAAQKALDLESTWRKFAVSTISREQYRREALGI